MAAAIQLNYRRPAAVAISLVHVCNHGQEMHLQKLGNNVLQSAGTCGPFPPVAAGYRFHQPGSRVWLIYASFQYIPTSLLMGRSDVVGI
jgi:hypothetical protein